MPTLVLDTETHDRVCADGSPARLVQLGWVRLDAAGCEVDATSVLVRPEGFVVAAGAERVHGISTARALAEGVPLAEALAALGRAAQGVRRLAAHNVRFDRAVLAAEAARLGLPAPLAGFPWTCTMEAGRAVCRLAKPSGRPGYKAPTLDELHRALLGAPVEGAHDALADARAAARCLVAMERPAGPPPAEPAPAAEAPPLPPLPPLTLSQQAALDEARAFLGSADHVLVLTGAAGTGKTTLLRAVLEAARAEGREVRLVAPTGRAARVAERRTGHAAATLHGSLYGAPRFESVDAANPGAPLTVRFALREAPDPPGTLYLVDEASMVADHADAAGPLAYGSGRLLSDLLGFAGLPARPAGRQVIFVGDAAQLPPVGAAESPALCPARLAAAGLRVRHAALTEVVRQAEGSGVLALSGRLRDALGRGGGAGLTAASQASGDVCMAADAVAAYVRAARRDGVDGVVLIARSNRHVTALNAGVRRARYGARPGLVERRERLLVVRNSPLHGLSNGDLVDVVEAAPTPERHAVVLGVPLAWRRVVVRHTETGERTEALLHESLLDSPAGTLSAAEQRALSVDFRQRHPRLAVRSEAFADAYFHDPYLNALSLRYGYALTCHKAQGGEWPTVVVATGARWWSRPDDLRWAYTALTRAQRRLVVCGLPRATAQPADDARAPRRPSRPALAAAARPASRDAP